MKLTKRLKKFKLRETLDDTNHNIQRFVSSNGKISAEFSHICFGRTVDQERKDWINGHNYHHPDNPIIALEVWQADNLSNAFLDTEVSDRVLSVMRSWGLFRNCTVERVLSRDVIFENAFATCIKNNSKYLLKLSFDFATIKPQEVWLVGWAVRHLSCHPILMLSFLKVLKRHPELPSWQVFLASFNVRFGKKEVEVYEGHLLATRNNLLLVKDVDIKTVLKLIDSKSYTTILKSSSYNISGGIAEKFSQISSSVGNGMIAIHKQTGRDKYIYRVPSEPYSKSLIESFFNSNVFKERYVKGIFEEEKVNALNFIR